ncbi:shikimate kinase [Spiribacter pallidus]|jgi:shikimate kinase|uniref:shikimate kinase n=1 Tax=Spiribacter pallidus TaxID=1987936 RepID=UPI0034A025B1
MTRRPLNIVLIGMPGAGKTTVGALLARRLGLAFADTDRLIEHREGQTLQQIVDTHGYQTLRAIEARVLTQLDCRGDVIATGGSAVYSDAAMTALQRHGVIVHLQVDLETILSRVQNAATRGLARAPGQSLTALFAEREALYAHYAEFSVDASGDDQFAVADRVIATLTRAHALPSPLA